MTANLQRGMTVKQAAMLMNGSERSVYMAGKVLRCSEELAAKVEAGKMSLNEAYRLVTNKPTPTSFDRLRRAWNSATDEDRRQLLERAGVLAFQVVEDGSDA